MQYYRNIKKVHRRSTQHWGMGHYGKCLTVWLSFTFCIPWKDRVILQTSNFSRVFNPTPGGQKCTWNLLIICGAKSGDGCLNERVTSITITYDRRKHWTTLLDMHARWSLQPIILNGKTCANEGFYHLSYKPTPQFLNHEHTIRSNWKTHPVQHFYNEPTHYWRIAIHETVLPQDAK